MSLHIFVNELKSWLPGGTLPEKIMKWLFVALGLAAFVALEVYIFMALDDQLEDFSSYGTSDFLVLFLFCYFIISSLVALPAAKKSLYRTIDREIISPLPVSDDDIILGKAVYLYVRLVINGLFLATPLLIAYGAARNLDPSFYVMSITYPFILGFVSLGLTLALLPLYALVTRFLERKYLIQLLLGIGVTLALCFIYQTVLNIFLSIVQGSRLDSYFSASFLESLHAAAPWLIPVANYFNLTISADNLISNILFLLGSVFLMAFLGLYLISFLYESNKERNFKVQKEKERKRDLKVLSSTRALMKKEFLLLFRNGSYLFSFSSLLFMQPFLAYVVISSLSSLLYSNLDIFMNYFSELPSGISLVIILLFASLVSSGASDGITREGKGRLFLKTAPLSASKMTFVKLFIPTGVALLSLFVTDVVLISFGAISVSVFFVALVSGSLLVVSVSAYGLLGDLSSYRIDKKGRGFYRAVPGIVSILFPLLIGAAHFLLMFFLDLDGAYIYLIEVACSILFFIPLVFVPKRLERMYLEMGAGV